MNVSIARYALGVFSLALVFGSIAYVAVSTRSRFFRDWTGAQARLTEVVIGLAALVAVLEVLGAVGLFRLGPIVAGCLLVALAGGRPRFARTRFSRAREPRPSAPLAVLVAAATAATAMAVWVSPTLQSYDKGVRTFDSLWYHLPWAATFAQTGHITPLHFADVQYLTAFYPATAELLHGLGIVLLGRDTLSPAINFVWLGLALLAAYCIGRPRGVGGGTVLGVAVALATPMATLSQAGSAANDVVGVFFLLAAVALVIAGEGEMAPLVLAGISAGLAIGTKLSLVAAALAVMVGALVIAPRGRRAAPAGAFVLAGGFWYVRNAIAVGNPVPWASLGFLPTPHPPLQQHTAFSVAHYLWSSRIWNQFFEPGLAAGLGRWWWAILAAAVLGPLLCLLPGAGRTVRMLGVVALASLAAYLITPESAAGPDGDPLGFAFNLRYAAPALALALVVLPLAPVFARPHRRLVVMAALAALVVATVWQQGLWPSQHVAGAVAIGAALLGCGLALRFAPRGLLVGGAAALFVAGAVAGYPWQGHYLRGRYAFNPGFNYLGHTWALFRGVHHARVGIVGTFGGFFSYPLYGLDDSNRVQYIAHRGPHGSFTTIVTCPEWRAAVDAARLRYVVTTPARDPWHPRVLGPSPEAAWTGSDPAARVVLTQRTESQRITVFELRGSLDPSRCS
jgi:hypothetical protein